MNYLLMMMMDSIRVISIEVLSDGLADPLMAAWVLTGASLLAEGRREDSSFITLLLGALPSCWSESW